MEVIGHDVYYSMSFSIMMVKTLRFAYKKSSGLLFVTQSPHSHSRD